MKNNILKIIGAVILVIFFVFLIDNKISDVSEVITYDFNKETILDISILYNNDDLSNKYTTYITINNDNTGIIEMWPCDEKPASYPKLSFEIKEDEIRELKDILNRYSIKNENTLNDFKTDVSGDMVLQIYANSNTYRFSNNVKDDNFIFIINYIKSLIPEDTQTKYDNEVKTFLEY